MEVEGQLFDSVKEAKRWIYLRSLEKAGKISDLHRQVKYVLIPTQRDDNRRVVERECAYIADFVYREGDRLIVEDVKGYKGGPAFAMFSIKRKLLLFRFGIKINVI